MYALERKVLLKTGHCPRYCWTRYAMSANRPLLEKVRAGQPKPKKLAGGGYPLYRKG